MAVFTRWTCGSASTHFYLFMSSVCRFWNFFWKGCWLFDFVNSVQSQQVVDKIDGESVGQFQLGTLLLYRS